MIDKITQKIDYVNASFQKIRFKIFQVVNDNDLCFDPIGFIINFQNINNDKWNDFKILYSNMQSYQYSIKNKNNYLERKTDVFLLFVALSSLHYSLVLSLNMMFKKGDISNIKYYLTDIKYALKCINECNGISNKIIHFKKNVNEIIYKRFGNLVNNSIPSKKNGELNIDSVTGIQTFNIGNETDIEFKVRNIGSDMIINRIREVVQNHFKKMKETNVILQDQKNFEDLCNFVNKSKRIDIKRSFTLKSCYIDVKDLTLRLGDLPGLNISLDKLQSELLNYKTSYVVKKFEIIKREPFLNHLLSK